MKPYIKSHLAHVFLATVETWPSQILSGDFWLVVVVVVVVVIVIIVVVEVVLVVVAKSSPTPPATQLATGTAIQKTFCILGP